MQKPLPKLTVDKDQNLADMTHFYVGPRFCEMKTVNKQDCFLQKEAEGTLAALEFLIAWGERLTFALVKFTHIIMKEIC